jgi:hypothetical protein
MTGGRGLALAQPVRHRREGNGDFDQVSRNQLAFHPGCIRRRPDTPRRRAVRHLDIFGARLTAVEPAVSPAVQQQVRPPFAADLAGLTPTLDGLYYEVRRRGVLLPLPSPPRCTTPYPLAVATVVGPATLTAPRVSIRATTAALP